MAKRTFIGSASAGNGHLKAASGVERAARIKHGEGVEVMNVDALQYSTALLRKAYSDGYIKLVNNMPGTLGLMYDSLDTPWVGHARRLALHRANCRALIKLMLDFQPTDIIATHFLVSELASYLICTKQLDATLSVVVTDFDAHAMWLCHHYDRFFVALPETKAYLSSPKIGLDENHICVTGIPIDPVFAQTKSKAEMRQKFGLDARPVILLSSGGLGVGPIDEILEELKRLRHPAQVVALCGRNEQLKHKLQDLAASSTSGPRIVPVGYTNEMDEYMTAGDIIVGKPGGLTMSEGLAKGLAFVIVNPIPGQEERNSHHLLEQGCGIRCQDLPRLAFSLDNLLANPARLHQMQANARLYSHPNAARDIVDIVDTLKAGETGTVYGKHVCPKPFFGC